MCQSPDEHRSIPLERPTAQAARAALEEGIRQLLVAAGEDPEREGLQATPARVWRAYKELLTPPPFEFTTFEANGYDQMVCVNNIKFYSLCEHHLLPFIGTVGVAYIPKDRIVGLSKLARAVDFFSRRVNTQEYMTHNIANFIHYNLDPIGVGVIVRGVHMCQIMRGAKKEGSMITSCLIGAFKDNLATREEFMRLCTPDEVRL